MIKLILCKNHTTFVTNAKEKRNFFVKKLIYWLFPIAWIGVIYYSSAQPYQNQDIKPLLNERLKLNFLEPIVENISFSYNQTEVSVTNLGLDGFVEFFIRKGAHIGVFFILALLFYLALRKSFPNLEKLNVFISFVLTVSYAGLDEWHQSFTPNRTAYLGDVVLDAMGALLAVCSLFIWISYRNYRSNKWITNLMKR